MLLGAGEPAVDELFDAVPGFSLVGVGHTPGLHAPVFLEDVHCRIQGGEFGDFLLGDVIGGVISLSQESKAPDDTELKLIRTAATFLGKQLEEERIRDRRVVDLYSPILYFFLSSSFLRFMQSIVDIILHTTTNYALYESFSFDFCFFRNIRLQVNQSKVGCKKALFYI